MSDTNYKSIEVSPISGALGALITGVELKEPLQGPVFEEIYKAFLEYFNESKKERKEELATILKTSSAESPTKTSKDLKSKKILQQKLSFLFIYSTIIVPPIPKDACGEHT